MIAGANRQIVTDRVDTLLKVGLGHRGKVRKSHCPVQNPSPIITMA